MPFVKAIEALNKKGELKKGYISKTNKLGRVNYMNDPNVKKKVVKKEKVIKESKSVKTKTDKKDLIVNMD